MTQHNNNLALNQQGKNVALLQSRLITMEYAIAPSEILSERFGESTQRAVLHFQKGRGLPVTGIVDGATAQAIVNRFEADKTVIMTRPPPISTQATPSPPIGPGDEQRKNVGPETGQAIANGQKKASELQAICVVEGIVASPDRAGIGGLRVQIVDKNVGPDVPLIETITDEHGHYQVSFSTSSLLEQHKQQPDLQTRIYVGQTFLAASDVRYNASMSETLHVKLPANSAALPSEHETLIGVLATHYKGQLGDLKESDDQQDITYLANKSGWDARAVALAALADQFSQHLTNKTNGTAEAGIHPAFYYALFRAGLPANQDTLYQTDASTAGQIWKQAIEQGVIPQALAKEIPQAMQTFQSLSATHILNAPALAGSSTLKEMLHLVLGDDVQHHQQFADLYTHYSGDLPKFWNAVQQSFGEATTKRLQLDGQLGYLTLNNAPLINRLHDTQQQKPLLSTLDLVQRGYYHAGQWEQLLDGSIPEQIPGDTLDEKRANYAELLATQVRLSFPTAVVAAMIHSDEIPLNTTTDVRDDVHTFLTENQGKFEIGMHPIEQYIIHNKLDDKVAAPVKEQIKRIQRVYQITLTDQAMTVLLKNNLDSAYQVVRYNETEFVQSFKDELGGENNARLTYTKSQQVHNAVLNIASSYITARNAFALGSNTDALIINPTPIGSTQQASNTSDVVASQTLEGLFGSLDYCTCEQCRSILSPAAYLVDLLLFIDRPVNDKENPQAVLLERRPDIEHLPLTCENTNIPVPYIDLVNETLEYFITQNLSLAGYTGYDTDGSTTSEELLASPQFVKDAAYDILKAELFPPPLPFHRPLEMLRRYFNKFGISLQTAMELLRADDAIERMSATTYGWRDILMEQLKLSRAEYTLLTDHTLTLEQIYGYAPTIPTPDVPDGLSNAKMFARRIGVTYEEVIELLKTKFINPNSMLIPQLEQLGVPFSTLKAFKDGTLSDAAFDLLLPTGLDEAEYGGDIKKWVKDTANYAHIMGMITLTNPTDSTNLCSFDQLEFRYTNPDPNANVLHAIEYVRLLRFIRLWRKIELTIEQTDKLITALYPAIDLPTGVDDAVDLHHLDTGFLMFLPRLGSIFQVMERLNLRPAKDLLGLLTCWSPIDTYGTNSLYQQMFLSPALLKQDIAFASDGYGNFLQDPGQKLVLHRGALRAAFNLTDDEFTLIVTTLRFDTNTLLTLDTISAIYRRGWLARKLRISVRELLLLIQFTNLDPFVAPDPANPPIIRLIQIIQDLRAASLKPVQALYLLWNQDISGKSVPDKQQITSFARTLRAAYASIESEFTVVDDPNGEVAHTRMTLVYGNDATNFFFGLLNNMLSVDVPYSHPQATLEQPILDAGRISYDDFRKRLIYVGVLSTTTRDALQTIVGVSTAFQTAVGALYTANQAAINPFFLRYPELLPLYSAYATSLDAPEKKRTVLLNNFLPELKKLRKRQQALTAMSSDARADNAFAQAILDDVTILHAAMDDTQSALDDLTALETPGLSAQFFWRDTATGSVDSTTDAVPMLAYSAAGASQLPANPTPDNAISAIWSGYLEAPENGFYNIAIETDAGAVIAVTFDGKSVVLAQNGTIWNNQNPLALIAGTLYTVVLQGEKVATTLAVRWETTGRGWEIIPARYLYSATLTDHLQSVYIRFLKAAALATGLTLTTNETAHFAAHADYHIGGQGWLNVLPVAGSPDALTSQTLRDVLAALLNFVRIKAALSPNDERLLSTLQDPSATLPDGNSLLLTLTNWESGSLDALLTHFGKNRADLTHLNTLRRVYDASTCVTTFGIAASALLTAAINEPEANTVSDLQAALRAHYAEADWLNVLKPINDEMRGLQRDALVAYVLQKLGENALTSFIDTPDRLFEYFLMDVQMDPCMQTSRIRHALSSVQLFIERCLMNLEQRVAPTSIEIKQWEALKRYRVREANLQVFLWPENWLEPELRDDQSPFFKEAMSELLQSDITEDTAATALLNYLSKLEEVAKLEPCGIYYVENSPGEADDIVHVVARTAGAHRKYYYRRREYGSWTPWEQIKLEIEDNPVVPVIWKGRLLLFWLRILKQTPVDPNAMPAPSSNPTPLASLTVGNLQTNTRSNITGQSITVQAVLCWSEYYNGKWQPTKTSDINQPTELGQFDPAGTNAFDRSRLQLRVGQLPGLPPDTLLVNIGSGSPFDVFGKFKAGFLLYNTHSLPLRVEDVFYPPFKLPPRLRVMPTGYPDHSSSTFSIYYMQFGGSSSQNQENTILQTNIGERVIESQPNLINVWDAPFFYEDSRNVFYVTTDESMVLLWDYNDYDIFHSKANSTMKQGAKIPPLVLQKQGTIPDKIGPVIATTNAGVSDPASMQRFVSEDANIRTAIGTSAAVQYGEREIGPMGSLSNENIAQEQ